MNNANQIKIIQDTREPQNNPQEIYMVSRGIKVYHAPLVVGDYALCSPEAEHMFNLIQTDRRKNLRHEILKKGEPTTKEEWARLKAIDAYDQSELNIARVDSVGTFDRAVDLKRSIKEIRTNFCQAAERRRIERECYRAKNLGIHLTFLILHETLTDIDELTTVMYHDYDIGRTVTGEELMDGIDPIRALPWVDFKLCRYNRTVQTMLAILQGRDPGDLS